MNKKIAYTGVFTAVIAVLTMGAIPIPGGGYIHIGDSVIFLCCFIMPLPFAIIAAGIGSCLADLILGYTFYAIPTLIIKSIMALVAGLFIAKTDRIFVIISGLILASLVMQGGYFLVNMLLLGEETSLLIVFFNLLQTIASVPLAYLLIKAVARVPDLDNVRLEWRKVK